jgi:hypothetical protein
MKDDVLDGSITHGHPTIGKYVLSLFETDSPPSADDEILALIADQARRFFPNSFRNNALSGELASLPIISYADHHGPLSHSLLLNSNVIFAQATALLGRKYSVVMATGNIPLNNLSYPKGFLFKGRKLAFFSRRHNYSSVASVKTPIRPDKSLGIQSLFCNLKNHDLSVEEKNFLHSLFFEVLSIEELSQEHEQYGDFISALNMRCWPYLFDLNLRSSLPRLVYLMSNDIINRLLIKSLKDEGSLVCRYLFDPSIRNAVLDSFYGIRCAWGPNQSGTHFFWKTDDNGVPWRLEYDPVSQSLKRENYTLPLRAESVIQALEQKEILPSLFFDFLLITFLGGIQTLGGQYQTEYLPLMQKAHCKILDGLGHSELSEAFASRKTDGLICGYDALPYADTLDLLWTHNSSNNRFTGNWDKGLTPDILQTLMSTPVEMFLTKIPSLQTVYA